jgi:hypothetical protein
MQQVADNTLGIAMNVSSNAVLELFRHGASPY